MARKITSRRKKAKKSARPSWKKHSFMKFLTVAVLIASFFLVLFSTVAYFFVAIKSYLDIDNLAGGLDQIMAGSIIGPLLIGLALFFGALCLLGFYYRDKTLLGSFIKAIITVPITILTVIVGILFIAALVTPGFQSGFNLILLISVVVLFYVNYLI